MGYLDRYLRYATTLACHKIVHETFLEPDAGIVNFYQEKVRLFSLSAISQDRSCIPGYFDGTCRPFRSLCDLTSSVNIVSKLIQYFNSRSF